MFQNFGFQELIIIFVIVLIIFGPKNLPKIGQALGKSIREFKNATHGLSKDIEDEQEEKKHSESEENK